MSIIAHKERPVFREEPVRTYPGYRGGSAEGNLAYEPISNLSKYRSGGMRILEDGHVIDSKYGIELDIEVRRAFELDTYNLRPDKFKYSMMINGVFRKGLLHTLRREIGKELRAPTVEEFMSAAEKLKGFALKQSREGFHEYENKGRNVFVDRVEFGSSVTIGVIQRRPVEGLENVTKGILPYAISLFHLVNPMVVSDAVLIRSIEIAEKCNVVMPRLRRDIASRLRGP